MDPKLNAFRVALAEQALAEADGAHGRPVGGPLAGVPIAVKDEMPLAGRAGDSGISLLRPPVGADAEVVAGCAPRGDPGRRHQRPRADDLPLDGERRKRGHPQPLEPRADAR